MYGAMIKKKGKGQDGDGEDEGKLRLPAPRRARKNLILRMFVKVLCTMVEYGSCENGAGSDWRGDEGTTGSRSKYLFESRGDLSGFD